MTDFKYHQKAAEMDERLEKIMESHSSSGSSAAPEQEPVAKHSGLQAYIDGQTIQDEIQALLSRPKIASEEIRAELARERITDIVEGRREKLSSFLAETNAAVEAMSGRDPVAETQALIRQGMDPLEAARKTLA
jgi:hypothetical protein